MWSNGSLVVFHGTDTTALSAYGPLARGAALTGFRVNLALCRPATDFGQGFYTTTSLVQAREWANTRTRRTRPRRAAAGSFRPAGVVIRFELDRDWLATLDSLAFIRPIADYWNFVSYCR